MSHWKLLFPSEYLRKEDLCGKDVTVTIKSVKVETVVGERGKKEDRPIARIEESDKKWILNPTNCELIEKFHKTPDHDQWVGKKVVIWHDPSVMFGGKRVGGIRVKGAK